MNRLAIITNPAINPKIGDASTIPAGSGYGFILQLFLTNFITIALGTAGIICFFMLLAGGIQYITAAGDKERTQNAGKRITNALIGLAITLSVFAIIYLVEIIFGISITHFNIPVIS